MARENFAKYGNPDGPGSYSVAIAMPRVLLKKENHLLVLVTSFFFMLVILPAYLLYNFADSTVKTDTGLYLDNKKLFGSLISENLTIF